MKFVVNLLWRFKPFRNAIKEKLIKFILDFIEPESEFVQMLNEYYGPEAYGLNENEREIYYLAIEDVMNVLNELAIHIKFRS